jgi:hypothetical protein
MKCTKKPLCAFSIAVLSLCLALAFSLSCPPALAYQEDIAVLATGGAILMSSPDTNAAPLAAYYAGVIVKAAKAQEDWYRVQIFKSPVEIIGYVPAGKLIFQDARGLYEMGIRVATILTGESGFVSLHEGPEDNAPILGEYPRGTRVSVFGEIGNYIHICIGERSGFVPKEALQYTDDVFSADTGVPAMGFGVFNIPSGGSEPLRAFPGQGEVFCHVPGDRSTVEILSNAGEWHQVRWRNDLQNGFLPSRYLKAYWLSDLIHDSNKTYTQGTYTVGQDLPSGLYTFTITEGENGSVQINLPGAQSKQYEVNGIASYTVYLPAKTVLTIGSGVSLAPTVPAANLLDFAGIRYTGSFKVLAGVQVPGVPINSATVSMAPGATSSYYVVSDFLTEEGLAGELVRKEMVPFAEYSIELLPGQFLEVFNGILWYRGTNG